MNEIYVAEKAAAFRVAETVSDYIVMFPDDGYSTTITANDSSAMRAVKEKLRSVHVALYKAVIFATAQLALSSNSDFKWLKGVAKHYDWDSQLADLHKQKQRIFDFEATKKKQEEKERAGNVEPLQPDLNSLMGPAERNPLHWAAALGDSQQVTFFVQSKEYPINALTMKSWTAAHLAAREGHTKILITLMTAPGIDLFVTNREGRTPLHVAVIYKQRSAAKVLLERNPGLLKPRDQWKRTAFLIAAEKGYVEILKVLKQYGQDMNETTVNQGWTALHLAAENGNVDTVKWLAENGTKKWTKVRDGPRKGLTAKEIAEQRGKTRVLEFL
jgi:ankyrin repeat protein